MGVCYFRATAHNNRIKLKTIGNLSMKKVPFLHFGENKNTLAPNVVLELEKKNNKCWETSIK